jgi:VanZ family protein
MKLRSLQHACRLLSWGCVPVLALLSLLPAQEMVRTGLPSRFEHVIAYAGTAAICAFGRCGGGAALRSAVLLIAYAGLLEWLQNFSPGRYPALRDFLASSLGVVAGTLLGLLALRLARRSNRRVTWY